MNVSVRAAVLTRPGAVSIEDRQQPQPANGEALVRVGAVGICGSDLHYFRKGRLGPYIVERPLILGHEPSGTIEAVGPGVSPDRIGERVAVEPGIPCRRCEACVGGRYNLCRAVRFLATPPVDGALVEFLTMPADLVHRIPSHLTDLEAALVEPTAVGVHAARIGRVGPGSVCVVFGAGPVGLLLLQVLRAFGAFRVTVVDPDASRVELAVKLGAEVVETDASAITPQSADVSFDASGDPAALAGSLRALRRGGRAVWIGLSSETSVQVPAGIVVDGELTVSGVFRYANAHPLAIDLIASGRVAVRPLISRTFDLDHAAEALELAARREPGVVKVIVQPAAPSS